MDDLVPIQQIFILGLSDATATTDDFMPLSHSSAALSGGRKNKIYAFRVRSNGARLASSSVDLGLLN